DAGRKIEYSLLLLNMIQSTLVNRHGEEVEYNLQDSFLISNESLVSYRYKYRAHIQLPLLLELVIFDPNNPRSLVYQLDRLKINLHGLPITSDKDQTPEHNALLQQIYHELELSHKDHLTLLEGGKRKYKNLETFLLKIDGLLKQLH